MESDSLQPIYTLTGVEHRGFFVMPQGLSEDTQLHIAERALTEYVEPPHRTNLTGCHEQKTLKDLWKTGSPLISKKLRWSAMGYHYDWTNRVYNIDQPMPDSPMPQELTQLCEHFTDLVHDSLRPEAALVNFYQLNSTMGGHQDNVEKTFEAPVVSFSIGSSAIFLKGGSDKSIPPIPCLLQSGDVVIMGQQSRLSVHGVPRIVENSNPLLFSPHMLPRHDSICEYLNHSRINVNLRQVFP